MLHMEPIVLDPAGSAAWSFGLPANPGLVGASVFFQAGLFDAGAIQSIALTDGLKLTFGV